MMPRHASIMTAAALVLGMAPGALAAADARAEIQINLCAPPEAIVRALDLRPAEALESWYFESPGLVHHGRGHVFRLRTGTGAPELTLKVADQDCARIKPELLPRGAGKCEYDIHGVQPKGAVSLSRTLAPDEARALIDGRRGLADALGPAQIRYLEATGGWPLGPNLQRLGPVAIRAYRAPGQKFVVEAWTLPGGQRFTEISEKASLAAAPARQAELEAMLDRAGVTRCADQSSQAGKKLEAMLSGS
jgi:hypothetical protein